MPTKTIEKHRNPIVRFVFADNIRMANSELLSVNSADHLGTDLGQRFMESCKLW